MGNKIVYQAKTTSGWYFWRFKNICSKIFVEENI